MTQSRCRYQTDLKKAKLATMLATCEPTVALHTASGIIPFSDGGFGGADSYCCMLRNRDDPPRRSRRMVHPTLLCNDEVNDWVKIIEQVRLGNLIRSITLLSLFVAKRSKSQVLKDELIGTLVTRAWSAGTRLLYKRIFTFRVGHSVWSCGPFRICRSLLASKMICIVPIRSGNLIAGMRFAIQRLLAEGFRRAFSEASSPSAKTDLVNPIAALYNVTAQRIMMCLRTQLSDVAEKAPGRSSDLSIAIQVVTRSANHVSSRELHFRDPILGSS